MTARLRFVLMVALFLPFAGCGSSDLPSVPPPPKGGVADTPPPQVVPDGYRPKPGGEVPKGSNAN